MGATREKSYASPDGSFRFTYPANYDLYTQGRMQEIPNLSCYELAINVTQNNVFEGRNEDEVRFAVRKGDEDRRYAINKLERVLDTFRFIH